MTMLDTIDLSRVVERRAEEHGERVAVVFERGDDPAVERTLAQLHDRSVRLASALTRAGVGRGDTVAVMLRNDPEFVDSILALVRIGAIFVPVDPRSRGAKLRHFLDTAKCTTMIVSDVAAAAACDILADRSLALVVTGTDEGRAAGVGLPRGATSFDEAIESWDGRTPTPVADDPDAPWSIAFTSGTTGDPKGIVVPLSRLGLYRAITDHFGYRPDDVTYTGLSLTHGNAQIATLFPALWGVVDRAVLSPWFTRHRLWEICARFGATTWSNLGGIATGVYSQPVSDLDRIHDVRLVLSAGMSADLWEAFEERFGVRVLEWYGTMEGGFACKPIGVGPIGSFGKPLEGLVEMEVHDGDGNPLPDGVIGELVARPVGGDAVVEYIDNPEASARKVRNGWLRTGDLVHRDGDGWFLYHRRRDETGLRRLGEFISTGFIARAIAELDDVDDVHIYGVPAPTGAPGEVEIVAAVTPTDGTIDVGRFWEHCQRELEASHVPDVLQIVDELPSTPSGKVIGRLLADVIDAPGAKTHRRSAAR